MSRKRGCIVREVIIDSLHTYRTDMLLAFSLEELVRIWMYGLKITCLVPAVWKKGERGMSQGTGKFDKNGDEMLVGDIVHFRTSGLSGKGVVYLAEKPDWLGSDLFRIRDTRPGKQNGRIYPFYPEAVYRIDGHEEVKE